MYSEKAQASVKEMIGRPMAERVFESLVGDVQDLSCKLAVELIGPPAFISGLEMLIPRLRNFAPGGAAARIVERSEQVILNALVEGEALDERPDEPPAPPARRG